MCASPIRGHGCTADIFLLASLKCLRAANRHCPNTDIERQTRIAWPPPNPEAMAAPRTEAAVKLFVKLVQTFGSIKRSMSLTDYGCLQRWRRKRWLSLHAAQHISVQDNNEQSQELGA